MSSSFAKKNENGVTPLKKVFTVIRTLFPIAARSFPFFYPLQLLKTLCDAAMPFLGVLLSPMIIDELMGNRRLNTLVLYACLLIGGEFLLTVVKQLAVNQLGKYQERLDNFFTRKTGEHAMELDFQLTEDKKALDQLEKANTGMSWYSGGVYGLSQQFFLLAGNILKIIGFTGIIALHAPLLLLVIVVYVAVNGWLTVKSNRIELQAYDRLSSVNRMFSYYGWEIVDFKYGKDIRLYHASDMLVNRWTGYTEDSINAWKWQADHQMKYNLPAGLLGILSSAVTCGYSGLLAIRGIFSVGIFSQMIAAAGALDSTLNGFVWNITELFKRSNYAYEYILFMNYPEALKKGTEPVREGLHDIEFKDVSFTYPGADRAVLQHVNLKVSKGERVSLVGLNGAGKTTLIKLLCRLYDPTEGRILLDGRDIREYDYAQYMKQFAPVFQDFRLFGFTVEENICLKDGDEITEEEREKAKALIQKTGLEEMLKKLKNGMKTTLFRYFEEDGIEPSGGEQQKLAIARALYKDAPVVILDEPTAALDPLAEYEIYRQFDSLVDHRTAFYISHRLSSCRFCDHIAVFSEGHIAEYGTHDELVKLPHGIYAGMFEAQAEYYR